MTEHHHRGLTHPISLEFATRPGTAGGRLEESENPRALLRTISTLRLQHNPYPSTSVPGSVAASARTSYTKVDMDPEEEMERGRIEWDLLQQQLRQQQEQQQQQQNGAEEEVNRVEPEDEEEVPMTPLVSIAFLLVSGKKRIMSFEPETAVSRVKELFWSSWPSDWQDERPPAPSYLRVLYLGRILQNDDTLTKLNFPTYTGPTPSTPTIVHLSIRPVAAGTNDSDSSALKKKRRSLLPDVDSTSAGGCCGCIVS